LRQYGGLDAGRMAAWRVAPGCFTVVDPKLEQAPEGVTLLRDLPEGQVFDLLMLGVKPQMLDHVAPQLNALAGPGTVVLSILAGAELASLSARFPMRRALCGHAQSGRGAGREPDGRGGAGPFG
jgi:pyrroline-5-carboxylate reductase